MSFDFGSVNLKAESEAGSWMTILSPYDGSPATDAEGNEAALFMKGPNSDVYRNVVREIGKRAEARKAELQAVKDDAKLSAEEREAKLAALEEVHKQQVIDDGIWQYCQVVTDWRHCSFGGSEKFSHKSLAAVLRQQAEDGTEWLARQINTHFLNAANFTKGRGKS